MEDLVYEIETIVINQFIIWSWNLILSDESDTQVITYIGSVMLPKDSRLSGLTMKENDGEEIAQLVACLHDASLLQTLIPLSIVLQKATGEIGSLVGGVEDTVEPSEIFPILCAFDDDEQCAQVKTLST